MLIMLVAAVTTDSSQIIVLVISFMYVTNPMFCFYVANFDIIINYLKAKYSGIAFTIPLAFGIQSTFYVSLACFAFQGFFFIIITMILDYDRSRKFRKPRENKAKITHPYIEPNEDVLIHEEIVKENNQEDEWMLRAVDLEMIYPSNGLRAVAPCTFGVPKGTVMGLLGPNGAGKSSTFSMLAMDLARSSGYGEIMGLSIAEISLRTHGN